MTERMKNNNREEERYRIAIIGASYAGLTLANVLERDGSISYTILEGKSMPFTYITGGKEFDVPFYHDTLLPQLLVSSPLPTKPILKSEVTRQEVTEQLLQRVQSHVQTHQKVIHISQDQQQQYFYVHTSDKQVHGPFDAVVGADGVRSLVRNYGQKGMYVIGDARWVTRRWYDFGTRRIQQGANIAMMDAYQFAQNLLQLRFEQHKYCAHHIRCKIQQQKQQVKIILLTILLTILYYNCFSS